MMPIRRNRALQICYARYQQAAQQRRGVHSRKTFGVLSLPPPSLPTGGGFKLVSVLGSVCHGLWISWIIPWFEVDGLFHHSPLV